MSDIQLNPVERAEELKTRAERDPGTLVDEDLDELVALLGEDAAVARSTAARAIELYTRENPESARLFADDLLPLLQDNDKTVRAHAAWAVGRLAKTHAPFVLGRHEDPISDLRSILPDDRSLLGLDPDSQDERRHAAWALAMIADEEPEAATSAVPELACCLHSSNEYTREFAALALANIASEFPNAVVDYTDDFLDVLDYHTSRVLPDGIVNTTLALARLAVSHPAEVKPAVTSLRFCLSNPEDRVRSNAALALARVASDFPDAVEPASSKLIERLEDPYDSTRKHAAKALSKLAETQPDEVVPATTQLRKLLEDDDEWIRQFAASAVAQVAREHPDEVQPAVEELWGLLTDDLDSTRSNAAWALAGVAKESPEDVVPAIGALRARLGDDYSHARERAALALQAIAESRPTDVEPAIEDLSNALDDGHDPVRVNAAATLHAVACEFSSVLRPVLDDVTDRLATDDSPKVRRLAAQTLDGVTDASPDDCLTIVDPLVGCLSDPDDQTRARVVRVLQRLANHYPTKLLNESSLTVDDLSTLLDDDYQPVRADAATTVGWLADEHPDDLLVVAPDLRFALDDSDGIVLTNVLFALGKIAETYPDAAAESSRKLVWLLDDDDPDVRSTAAWILVTTGFEIDPDCFPRVVPALVDNLPPTDRDLRGRVQETLEGLEPVAALDQLEPRLADEEDSDVIEWLTPVIDTLRDRVRAQARQHASSASELAATGDDHFDESHVADAYDAYTQAIKEYNRAIELATHADWTDLADEYENDRVTIAERRTLTQVAKISQDVHDAAETIVDDPEAATAQLKSRLDMIDTLDAEVSDGLQVKLQRIAETAREQLWVAHLEPLQARIRKADQLLADGALLDAKDAYREAKHVATSYASPPDRAVAPGDAADAETLRERCDSQIAAIEQCLVTLEDAVAQPDPVLSDSYSPGSDGVPATEGRGGDRRNEGGGNVSPADDTSPPSDPSPTGTQAEPPAYEEKSRIGRGGHATVWRLQLGGGDVVALKRPHPRTTLTFDERQRFVTAAETWAGIDDHPTIVTVRDWGDDGEPWLLTEYVEGGDLTEHEGSLSVADALDVLIDVATAITHARGVDHLDIKPANVLLGKSGTAKLADWGLARVAFANEALDTSMGVSPPFAAPEQVDRTLGPLDQRTDIYQFGVTAYELLTGELPFDPTAPESLERRILGDQPPDPHSLESNVPPMLSDIIMRTLAKSPADRIQYPANLLSELHEVRERL